MKAKPTTPVEPSSNPCKASFKPSAYVLFAGICCAYAASIPYLLWLVLLGWWIGRLAPDVFLVGLCMFCFVVAQRVARSVPLVVVVGSLLSLIAGLNTRIPSILADLAHESPHHIEIVRQIQLQPWHPIRIDSDEGSLSARRDTYAHAVPAGDSLVQRGFRTPIPRFTHDYWEEDIEQAAIEAGFAIYESNSPSPVLSIRQRRDGYQYFVDIQLWDADGNLAASQSSRYRTGFPAESADGKRSTRSLRPMVHEFLLHGNAMNRIVELFVPRAPNEPLSMFLKEVVVPLEQKSGTASRQKIN